MKYYTITVNGNTYNVSVQEGIAAPAPVYAAPVAPVTPVAPVASAPVAPAVPVVPTPAPSAGGVAGNVKVNAPMPGKIVAVKASVGQAVKKGDVILILEAMKMENEIVSPQDGVLVTIDVAAGQSVEAGALLATLN